MPEVSKVQISTEVKVTLVLTESEARALDAIFGYDPKVFLRVFYEKMGEAYVKPHESGVLSLHKSMRGIMSGPLATIDHARRAMNQALRS